MYIKQGDLFYGTGTNFLKNIMAICKRELYGADEFLFRRGDPASHFYILISGCIHLVIRKTGDAVYQVCQSGEIIGCSSLVGADVYITSAVCQQESHVLKFQRDEFYRILEKDPDSERAFYRALIKVLGGRLMQSFERIDQRFGRADSGEECSKGVGNGS